MSVAADVMSDVMSDARNRRTVWLALAVLAAALAAVWCYGKLVASREQAAAAAAELAECRRYADAIGEGRKAPSLASAEQPQAELGRRIERAAKAAKLPAGGVERIGAEQQARLTPQTVRRSRQVILRGVTLRQTMTFLHELSAADRGLRVQDLRLTAPRGDAAGDRWGVEATLAYEVNEPQAG